MNKTYDLTGRSEKQENTIIRLNDISIGDKEFALIAGPCSIENEQQAFEIAEFLHSKGIRLFRAGAYKPRTSPYSFQGLGKNALDIIKKIKKETGLKVITEAMDIDNTEYSDERLENLTCKLNELSAKEALDKILEDVDLFTGGIDQSDDITCIVVKVNEV